MVVVGEGSGRPGEKGDRGGCVGIKMVGDVDGGKVKNRRVGWKEAGVEGREEVE